MNLDFSTSAHQEIATKISLGGSFDSDSSAGLPVIFKAQKKVEASGGEIVMVNLRPQVEKVFEIVKQLPSWSIFQNDAEMDEYLQAVQSKAADQS